MFISDFAIKRPIITVVTMIALVVFGARRALEASRPTSSPTSSADRRVAIAYPGASPDVVEREVVEPIEEQIAGDQRRRQDQLDVDRRLRADHRPVRLLEGRRPGDAGRARRDLRACARSCRRRSSSRSSSSSIRTTLPIVSLALTSTTLTPPQLTQLADPDDRRRAARDRRRGAGERRRRRQRAAQRRACGPTRSAARAGVGIDQVVQRAARAEPRGAGRPRERRRSSERSIRLEGRLERPEEFAQLVVAAAQRAARSASGRSPTCDDGDRGAALARRCSTASEAIGLDIVKSQGLQHDRR